MNTADPIQLDVMILGREYRVACRESEHEDLMKAVAHLDTRMREIRDTGKVNGAERIAVMAALNITNDLLRERKQPLTRRGGQTDGSGSTVGDTIDGNRAGSAVDAPDAQRRIREIESAIDKALAAQDKLF